MGLRTINYYLLGDTSLIRFTNFAHGRLLILLAIDSAEHFYLLIVLNIFIYQQLEIYKQYTHNFGVIDRFLIRKKTFSAERYTPLHMYISIYYCMSVTVHDVNTMHHCISIIADLNNQLHVPLYHLPVLTKINESRLIPRVTSRTRSNVGQSLINVAHFTINYTKHFDIQYVFSCCQFNGLAPENFRCEH